MYNRRRRIIRSLLFQELEVTTTLKKEHSSPNKKDFNNISLETLELQLTKLNGIMPLNKLKEADIQRIKTESIILTNIIKTDYSFRKATKSL